MSSKILFFGNERLATAVTTSAPTLRALIDAGYEIGAVVVAQNPLGKSRSARELEVETIARDYNTTLLSPADLREAKDELLAYGAELGVLIAYGKIIPSEILEIFPKGIINVHPSLLPLHRGSAPIESVMLEGAGQTGVSLMKLASKMDTGPVHAQQKVELTGQETKQELADRLSVIGAQMVIETLPKILDGTATPEPQDESLATYDKHISKEDSVLDWSKPASRLEREIRAYAGWPRSRTTIGSVEVIITGAHISDDSGQPGAPLSDTKQLGFYTAEKALIIDSLIPAGKKEMSAQAFLAGYR